MSTQEADVQAKPPAQTFDPDFMSFLEEKGLVNFAERGVTGIRAGGGAGLTPYPIIQIGDIPSDLRQSLKDDFTHFVKSKGYSVLDEPLPTKEEAAARLTTSTEELRQLYLRKSGATIGPTTKEKVYQEPMAGVTAMAAAAGPRAETIGPARPTERILSHTEELETKLPSERTFLQQATDALSLIPKGKIKEAIGMFAEAGARGLTLGIISPKILDELDQLFIRAGISNADYMTMKQRRESVVKELGYYPTKAQKPAEFMAALFPLKKIMTVARAVGMSSTAIPILQRFISGVIGGAATGTAQVAGEKLAGEPFDLEKDLKKLPTHMLYWSLFEMGILGAETAAKIVNWNLRYGGKISGTGKQGGYAAAQGIEFETQYAPGRGPTTRADFTAQEIQDIYRRADPRYSGANKVPPDPSNWERQVYESITGANGWRQAVRRGWIPPRPVEVPGEPPIITGRTVRPTGTVPPEFGGQPVPLKPEFGDVFRSTPRQYAAPGIVGAPPVAAAAPPAATPPPGTVVGALPGAGGTTEAPPRPSQAPPPPRPEPPPPRPQAPPQADRAALGRERAEILDRLKADEADPIPPWVTSEEDVIDARDGRRRSRNMVRDMQEMVRAAREGRSYTPPRDPSYRQDKARLAEIDRIMAAPPPKTPPPPPPPVEPPPIVTPPPAAAAPKAKPKIKVTPQEDGSFTVETVEPEIEYVQTARKAKLAMKDKVTGKVYAGSPGEQIHADMMARLAKAGVQDDNMIPGWTDPGGRWTTNLSEATPPTKPIITPPPITERPVTEGAPPPPVEPAKPTEPRKESALRDSISRIQSDEGTPDDVRIVAQAARRSERLKKVVEGLKSRQRTDLLTGVGSDRALAKQRGWEDRPVILFDLAGVKAANNDPKRGYKWTDKNIFIPAGRVFRAFGDDRIYRRGGTADEFPLIGRPGQTLADLTKDAELISQELDKTGVGHRFSPGNNFSEAEIGMAGLKDKGRIDATTSAVVPETLPDLEKFIVSDEGREHLTMTGDPKDAIATLNKGDDGYFRIQRTADKTFVKSPRTGFPDFPNRDAAWKAYLEERKGGGLRDASLAEPSQRFIKSLEPVKERAARILKSRREAQLKRGRVGMPKSPPKIWKDIMEITGGVGMRPMFTSTGAVAEEYRVNVPKFMKNKAGKPPDEIIDALQDEYGYVFDEEDVWTLLGKARTETPGDYGDEVPARQDRPDLEAIEEELRRQKAEYAPLMKEGESLDAFLGRMAKDAAEDGFGTRPEEIDEYIIQMLKNKKGGGIRIDLLPEGWSLGIGKTRTKEGQTAEGEVDWRGKVILFSDKKYMDDPEYANHEIAHVMIEDGLPETRQKSLLNEYVELKKDEPLWKKHGKDWIVKNQFHREEIAMDLGKYLNQTTGFENKLGALFDKYFPGIKGGGEPEGGATPFEVAEKPAGYKKTKPDIAAEVQRLTSGEFFPREWQGNTDIEIQDNRQNLLRFVFENYTPDKGPLENYINANKGFFIRGEAGRKGMAKLKREQQFPRTVSGGEKDFGEDESAFGPESKPKGKKPPEPEMPGDSMKPDVFGAEEIRVMNALRSSAQAYTKSLGEAPGFEDKAVDILKSRLLASSPESFRSIGERLGYSKSYVKKQYDAMLEILKDSPAIKEIMAKRMVQMNIGPVPSEEDLKHLAKMLRKYFSSYRGADKIIDQQNDARIGGRMAEIFDQTIDAAKINKWLKDQPEGTNEYLAQLMRGTMSGDGMEDIQNSALPADIKEAMLHTRQRVDRLSDLVITHGGLVEETRTTFENNIGKYLAKAYRLYQDKHWSPTDAQKDAFKRWLMNEYTMTPEQADEFIEAELAYGRNDEGIRPQRSRRTRRVPTEHYIRRKVLSPAWREFAGEIDRLPWLVMHTITKQATMAYNAKFLDWISEYLPDHWTADYQEAAQRGWQNSQFAEHNYAYGKLAGKWVDPELYQYIKKEFETARSDMEEAIQKFIMNPFKWTKTIGSLPSHSRNFLSNFGFSMLLRNSIMNPLNAKWYAKSLNVHLNKTGSSRDMWANLIEEGVTETQFYGAEIPRMHKDVMRFDPATWPEKIWDKFVSWPIDKLGELYNFGDSLYRVSAYLKNVAPSAEGGFGMTPTKAVEEINAGLQNYRKLPVIVDILRRWPVLGPFVSFKANTVKIIGNQARMAAEEIKVPATRSRGISRWLRLALFLSVPAILSEISKKIYDVDDKQVKELERWYPEYRRNGTFLYFRGEDDKLKVFDFSFLWPTGDIERFGKSILKGDIAGAKDSLDFFSHPLLDVWSILAKGQDPQWGTKYRTIVDRAKAAAAYLYLPASMPIPNLEGLLHGDVRPGNLTGTQIKAVIDAYNGQPDQYGRVKQLPEEIKNFFSGIRTWDVDPEKLLAQAALQRSGQIRDLQGEFTKWLRKNTLAPQWEKDAKKKAFLEEIEKISAELRDIGALGRELRAGGFKAKTK